LNKPEGFSAKAAGARGGRGRLGHVAARGWSVHGGVLWTGGAVVVHLSMVDRGERGAHTGSGDGRCAIGAGAEVAGTASRATRRRAEGGVASCALWGLQGAARPRPGMAGTRWPRGGARRRRRRTPASVGTGKEREKGRAKGISALVAT